MKLVILIGFCYEYGKHDYLYGSIVDLYKSYIYVSKVIKPDKILVFTDSVKEQNGNLILEAITNGEVTNGILTFIDEIKHKDEYVYCLNSQDLIHNLKGLRSKYIYFYYSGHGENNSICLPEDNYSIKSLMNRFYKILIGGGTLISIFDCCDGIALDLPYLYSKNPVRIKESPEFTSDIISISSSNINEQSISGRLGSLFTNDFYKLITKNLTIASISEIATIRMSSDRIKILPLILTDNYLILISKNWLLFKNLKLDGEFQEPSTIKTIVEEKPRRNYKFIR